ncbi:hypothetical protein D3C73_1566240 [compost metagenome]
MPYGLGSAQLSLTGYVVPLIRTYTGVILAVLAAKNLTRHEKPKPTVGGFAKPKS